MDEPTLSGRGRIVFAPGGIFSPVPSGAFETTEASKARTMSPRHESRQLRDARKLVQAGISVIPLDPNKRPAIH
jgi:hypothetical protein